MVEASAGWQLKASRPSAGARGLERGILVKKSSGNSWDRAMVFQDPRPLKHGKTSFHQFTAGSEFFSLMRHSGQRGYTTALYIFDGQYAEENYRHFTSRHELYYTHGPALTDAENSCLKDLTIGIKCKAHVCSNAVQWSLAPWTSEEQFTDTYLVIRACRRVHTALQEVVPEFVGTRCSFRETEPPEHQKRQLWACMGVDPRMMDMFILVHPLYLDGRLWVNKAVKSTPSHFHIVCDVVSYCLRWAMFSKTRWCGTGPSQRRLLLSCMAGVDGLVDIAKQSTHVSGEDLNSFFRKSSDVMRFACVASLSTYPQEQVCLELLNDDRLALRLNEFKSLHNEEISYVMSLDFFVYESLAPFCGPPTKEDPAPFPSRPPPSPVSPACAPPRLGALMMTDPTP